MYVLWKKKGKSYWLSRETEKANFIVLFYTLVCYLMNNSFGVPQGWIPICAMNQCRAPEFCLAIEAPVLLGSCSFSFFFFPLH